MGERLEKLISIGSPSMAAGAGGSAGEQLPPLLAPLFERKNGFYAFESALLVRPFGAPMGGVLDIASWNARHDWAGVYGDDLNGVVLFAEDLFGCQFGVSRDGVVSFNPESGEVEFLAATIEEWAARLLGDFEVMTGHPLAHDWQTRHRSLAPGERLFPVVPFVLGGDFTVDNLRPAADVKGIRFYAELFRATSQVPDGGQLRVDLAGLARILD